MFSFIHQLWIAVLALLAIMVEHVTAGKAATTALVLWNFMATTVGKVSQLPLEKQTKQTNKQTNVV